MEFFLAIIIAVLLSLIFLLLLKLQDKNNELLRSHGKGNFYEKRTYFLTGSEKALLEKLRQIIPPDNYELFPQIHLSSLVRVKSDKNDLEGKFNFINKLCVDFVIFDKKSLLPLSVIELNDPSHLWGRRENRDEFVRSVLDSVGLPLLELQTANIPKLQLRDVIPSAQN